MLLSAVSVLVVAQSSSEVPEGLMNNPVCVYIYIIFNLNVSIKLQPVQTTICETGRFDQAVMIMNCCPNNRCPVCISAASPMGVTTGSIVNGLHKCEFS